MAVGIDIDTSAGTTLHIGSTLPAALTQAGFENPGIVYTKVARITDFGEFTQEFTPIPFGDVEMRLEYTLKGTEKLSPVTIQLARAVSDAGQAAIAAAYESDSDYTFKITLPDGEKKYFIGRVVKNGITIGGAETITGNSVTIVRNSKTVSVVTGTVYRTLTYTAGENGTLIGLGVQQVVNGSSGTAVYAAPSALYEFDKWSDNSVANPRTDSNVTVDITVSAAFKLIA